VTLIRSLCYNAQNEKRLWGELEAKGNGYLAVN